MDTDDDDHGEQSIKKHFPPAKLADRLRDPAFIEIFHKHWTTSDTFECNGTGGASATVHLHQSPFQISVVQDFLQNPHEITELVNEMTTSVDWQRKQMDLYEFYQSSDLSGFTAQPKLSQFYNALRLHLMPWMEQLTGIRLTHVSASCSMYNNGDHLLVHDDMLADRRIAYVFYLSPWSGVERWTPEMGGALELFPFDPATGQPTYPIERSFVPQNNQFVFFPVSSVSFHQVAEVTNLVYPRLTINGWFHGPPIVDSLPPPFDKIPRSIIPSAGIQMTAPNTELQIDLTEWINGTYLKSDVKKSIQKQIELKSEVSLNAFFVPDFYSRLASELQKIDAADWQLQGPANQKKYESLRLRSLSSSAVGPIDDLMRIFLSSAMFGLLYEYTELDLAGAAAMTPNCTVDIHRITAHSYSLLGDAAGFGDSSLDVIVFFNANDNDIGIINYLNPEAVAEVNVDLDTDDDSDDDDDDVVVGMPSGILAGDDDDEDDDVGGKETVLLSVMPKDNALNLVYRSAGTAKFLKYISKSCLADNEFVYILIASYRE